MSGRIPYSITTSTSGEVTNVIGNLRIINEKKKLNQFFFELERNHKAIGLLHSRMITMKNTLKDRIKHIFYEILLTITSNPNLVVEYRDGKNNTALMILSKYGIFNLVKLLLEKGADPNIQNNDGNTALIKACNEGHTEIVQLLLKDGRTDPNIQNNNGNTPLIFACYKGHTTIVELLLNERSQEGSQEGSQEVPVSERDIDKRTDPNIQNKHEIGRAHV